jgi:hypothetical protein
MSYTLATAAKATGLNRSTILRAIKSGHVTGIKDQLGEWRIEPADHHRVFLAIAELSAGSGAGRRYAASRTKVLEAEIEALIKRAENAQRHRPCWWRLVG